MVNFVFAGERPILDAGESSETGKTPFCSDLSKICFAAHGEGLLSERVSGEPRLAV